MHQINYEELLTLNFYLTFSGFFRICSEPFLFQLMNVGCLASYYISDITVCLSTKNVTEKCQWIKTDLSMLSYILSLLDTKIFESNHIWVLPLKNQYLFQAIPFQHQFPNPVCFQSCVSIAILKDCSIFYVDYLQEKACHTPRKCALFLKDTSCKSSPLWLQRMPRCNQVSK